MPYPSSSPYAGERESPKRPFGYSSQFSVRDRYERVRFAQKIGRVVSVRRVGVRDWARCEGYGYDERWKDTHLSPGQGLDDIDAWNEVELLQQHSAAFLEVHSVEVKAFDADVRGEDLLAQICDKIGNEV